MQSNDLDGLVPRDYQDRPIAERVALFVKNVDPTREIEIAFPVLREIAAALNFKARRMVLLSKVCHQGYHPMCDLHEQADCECKCHGGGAK